MFASLTPELSASLRGPAWLAEQRIGAVERAAGLPWPTTQDEVWRYSRIGDLDPAAYDWAPTISTIDSPAGYVERAAGVAVPAAAPIDLFSELVLGFNDDPVVVRVPAGQTVSEPIIVTHSLVDGGITLPRLLVFAGCDSEVTVIERFLGSGKGLMVSSVEIVAEAAARVRYQAVNELGIDSWLIANQSATGERDSTLFLGTVSLGGDYSRVRTEVRLTGQGAHAEQVGLSFGEGDQMHDFRVTQVHAAPKTTSDLLFKSAVEGRSRSVYTGLIHIEKTARGSKAFQTNRNLKLSDLASSESVPNLDIENNDVKCSHASTSGPVDADQKFYLESRGVPPSVAERLIVLGFFDDVIDRLPAVGLRPVLRAEVAGKLDRRLEHA